VPRVSDQRAKTAAERTTPNTIFLPFLKFQISKFHLKLRNYPSKHTYHTPRRKNQPFVGEESEGIEG
jgi:hypothetical protein